MACDPLSSPDPLASEYNKDFHSNSPSKPSHIDFDTNIGQHLYRRKSAGDSSPSKTVAEQLLSPWRIRVTVEAEPEEGPKLGSDGSGMQIVTRTMTVPLRNEQSSSPTKTRKSLPGLVKKSKRRSVTDLNTTVLGDDGEEDEWRADPKSPRKRRGSKTKAATKSVSRPAATSDTFDIMEDGRMESQIHTEIERVEDDSSQELRQIDPNQVALREKKSSASLKEVAGTRQVSVNSARSYPTPSPTASEHGDRDDNGQDAVQEVGLQTIIESEGFTMIDLDSLHAIKQLRSSPYTTEETSIANENIEVEKGTSGILPDTDKDASSIHSSVISAEDTEIVSNISSSSDETNGPRTKTYSIGHLQLPSSLRIHRHRHVTPLPQHSQIERSSPPPLPRSTPTIRDSTTISKKAMEAGIALRDAVTPEPEIPPTIREDIQDQYDAEAKIFGGFSAGTRRELRADLRFGEELGIRQSERGQEAAVNVTISPSLAQKQVPVSAFHENIMTNTRDSQTSNELLWDRHWQDQRKAVIQKANKFEADQVITINSDEEEQGYRQDVDEGETTIGDIWLAEAKNASNSPKDAEEQQTKPRRKLIPSPWKRGEQIASDTSSYLSGDQSMSGLFWQMSEPTGNVRFGDGVLAHPDQYDRGAKMFADGESCTKMQPEHLGRIEEMDEEPVICWRSAQDVVDEETDLFENEKAQTKSKAREQTSPDESVTNLYETNLDAIPEQDLLSPSQEYCDLPEIRCVDHDSTYSSISEVDSIAAESNQRTSLSPSKERPNTPRSAMKGSRASFGQALAYDGFEEEKRRVVWAQRAACVNEMWEESSRSIRSTQESTIDETPTPIAGEKVASYEKAQLQPEPKSRSMVSLDGSIDAFVEQDTNGQGIVSYAPSLQLGLSEHVADTCQKVVSQEFSNQNLESKPIGPELERWQSIPSYLKPPSYPTVPGRDISRPLAVVGDFSNIHFRTLHILYRKSQRPQFHAPQYPNEVRPAICDLVENQWSLVVDESETMGERFTFRIGVVHARVVERFMQEIEWDWKNHGIESNELEWGWSTEQIATWLGRVIVGEAVRADEKAAMLKF